MANAAGHQQAHPEDDLYGAVESAYSQGWRRMKLYFLTGLPTETDVDTLGIAELAKKCVAIGKRYTHVPRSRSPSAGSCPKPHTPFQWFGQNTVASCSARSSCCATRPGRHGRAAEVARPSGHARRRHRQPRRSAHRRSHRARVAAGGTFQEWSECFDVTRWHEAMAAHGLSVDWYVHRHRTEDEVLPWAHVTAGLHADFLWHDWQAALAESGVEDCRWTPCYDCGVCTGYAIEHVVASATPPAGGSQGTGQDRSVGGQARSAPLIPVRAAS